MPKLTLAHIHTFKTLSKDGVQQLKTQYKAHLQSEKTATLFAHAETSLKFLDRAGISEKFCDAMGQTNFGQLDAGLSFSSAGLERQGQSKRYDAFLKQFDIQNDAEFYLLAGSLYFTLNMLDPAEDPNEAREMTAKTINPANAKNIVRENCELSDNIIFKILKACYEKQNSKYPAQSAALRAFKGAELAWVNAQVALCKKAANEDNLDEISRILRDVLPVLEQRAAKYKQSPVSDLVKSAGLNLDPVHAASLNGMTLPSMVIYKHDANTLALAPIKKQLENHIAHARLPEIRAALEGKKDELVLGQEAKKKQDELAGHVRDYMTPIREKFKKFFDALSGAVEKRHFAIPLISREIFQSLSNDELDLYSVQLIRAVRGLLAERADTEAETDRDAKLLSLYRSTLKSSLKEFLGDEKKEFPGDERLDADVNHIAKRLKILVREIRDEDEKLSKLFFVDPFPVDYAKKKRLVGEISKQLCIAKQTLVSLKAELNIIQDCQAYKNDKVSRISKTLDIAEKDASKVQSALNYAEKCSQQALNQIEARRYLAKAAIEQNKVYLAARHQRFRWRDILIEFFFGWLLKSDRQKRTLYIGELNKALEHYAETGDKKAQEAVFQKIKAGKKQFGGRVFVSLLLEPLKDEISNFEMLWHPTPNWTFKPPETACEAVRENVIKREFEAYRKVVAGNGWFKFFYPNQHKKLMDELAILKSGINMDKSIDEYSKKHEKDLILKPLINTLRR